MAHALSNPLKRVLVVDDNRDAADSLALILRLSGVDVRQAYDGLQASEVAATFLPDVAILDLNMPGMDGFELAAKLLTLPVPPMLLAVSADTRPHIRDRARAYGFRSHIAKPADPKHLLALILSSS